MSNCLVGSIKNVKRCRDLKRARAIKHKIYTGTEKTKNRTYISNGFEFNQLPCPKYLIKAMEREWAEKLVEQGLIRLNALEYYQNFENKELGDNLEGKGELLVAEHQFNAESINTHYIWCGARPGTNRSLLLGMDDKYDVIVRINDVRKFTSKILAGLLNNGYVVSRPQLGKINYNRSADVNLTAVKEQKWLWNCFQKQKEYFHQNEYRIVFSDLSMSKNSTSPIDLKIGPCKDFIKLFKR